MQTFSNMLLFMPPSWLVRAAVALLWLYEGLWCKVLGHEQQQATAVGTVGLSEITSRTLFKVLGYFEVVLAGWVGSNSAPGWCALAQTGLVCVGALAFASAVIHDPAGVVFKNLRLRHVDLGAAGARSAKPLRCAAPSSS